MPTPLRLEDQLNYFTDRTPSASCARDIVRDRTGLCHGVCDRYRQFRSFHDRNIRQIVAHESHFAFSDSSLLQQLFEGRDLVGFTLSHKLNSQLRGAARYGL